MQWQIQFNTFLFREPVLDSIAFGERSISRSFIYNFIEIYSQYKINRKISKPSFIKPKLEYYEIGQTYYLCGFLDADVPYRNKTKGFHKVPFSGTIFMSTCSSGFGDEYKVLGYDDENLELLSSNYIKESSIEDQIIYVPRKSVSTHYILSDGEFQIAVTATNLSKVIAGKEFFIIEDKNTSCDNEDLAPIVEVDLTLDNLVKAKTSEDALPEHHFTYPKGFDFNKIFFKKNYYGSSYREWECGT